MSTGSLLTAIDFAAEKHRNQRRKNAEQTPYINHPIGVATQITRWGFVADMDVLCAAILHDTVEDTDTTWNELTISFGQRITDMVREVSDDKSLPKDQRKRLQVGHARKASFGARLIKLADKYHNLNSFFVSPPKGWSAKRIQGYFVWSKSVVYSAIGDYQWMNIHADFTQLFSKAFELNGISYPCIPQDVNLDEFLEEYYSDMARVDD